MYDRIPGALAINTPLTWQCWCARAPVPLNVMQEALRPGFGERTGRAIAAAFRHDLFHDRCSGLADQLEMPEQSMGMAIRRVRRELAMDGDVRGGVERALRPLGVRRFNH